MTVSQSQRLGRLSSPWICPKLLIPEAEAPSHLTLFSHLPHSRQMGNDAFAVSWLAKWLDALTPSDVLQSEVSYATTRVDSDEA